MKLHAVIFYLILGVTSFEDSIYPDQKFYVLSQVVEMLVLVLVTFVITWSPTLLMTALFYSNAGTLIYFQI